MRGIRDWVVERVVEMEREMKCWVGFQVD